MEAHTAFRVYQTPSLVTHQEGQVLREAQDRAPFVHEARPVRRTGGAEQCPYLEQSITPADPATTRVLMAEHELHLLLNKL